MSRKFDLETLITAVSEGARYRGLHPGLVRRVSAQELAKGRGFKDTVKAVRSKLHQVGGAYQEDGLDFPRWSLEMDELAHDRQDEALRSFCRRVMASHVSTRERLPLLDAFFPTVLEGIGPLHSVCDLACGLNPLAAAWMPLAPDARYTACDIYTGLVDFLNAFFAHIDLAGEASLCDLVDGPPAAPVQAAFVLKTLPCLEQLDRDISLKLLQNLNAEHVIVSFPAQSLGGHGKGMRENYSTRFEALTAGQNWQVRRFEFSTEVVYRLSR